MSEVFPPTIAQAAPEIRAGRLSPVALVELCLARIARHDGHLRSFLLVAADEARAAARQAEAEIARGQWRGPLHGIPVAIKDAIDGHGSSTRIPGASRRASSAASTPCAAWSSASSASPM
ncbi:MAG: amidase family protein, partial [Alphaproteobacteria bacterium]